MINKYAYIFVLICSFNLIADVCADEEFEGMIIVPLGPACEVLKDNFDQPQKLPEPLISKDPVNSICSNKLSVATVNPSTINLINQIGKVQTFEERKDILQSCKNIASLSKKFTSLDQVHKDKDGKKWKVKFYFGNSKTWYDKTDVTVKSSRLDVKISGASIYERRSDSGLNFHNWIDEPTNDGTFTLSHGKNVFILDSFHDKNVFVEGDQEATGHHYNENVHVKGTVDGVAIDKNTKLKGDFGPDRQLLPGNVYVVSWENAHKQMQFQLGYGREIDLIKSKGVPVVKFTPAVMAGVYVGILNSSYTKKGQGWEWDKYESDKVKIMGESITASGRLEVNDKRDRIGVFVEGKYSMGQMKYGFLDGTAEHKQNYKSITFGVEAKIIPFFKKKPKNLDESTEVEDVENGKVVK